MRADFRLYVIVFFTIVLSSFIIKLLLDRNYTRQTTGVTVEEIIAPSSLPEEKEAGHKPPPSISLEQVDIDAALKEAKTFLLDNENTLRQLTGAEPVYGKIDERFYKKILALIPRDNVKLLVYSPGGNARFAMLSAQLISESQHSIIVLGHCTSACAEYLLPAAAKIEFRNRPLVGFHGNPISNSRFVKKTRGPNANTCEPSLNHRARMKKMYAKNGINFDFWQLQYKHLVLETVSIVDVSLPLDPKFQVYKDSGINIENPWENCALAKITTKHKMWYPTSKQLRDDFGLKFTGDVCADDYDCYSARLNKIGKDGDSYAVGDTVFVVNKQSEK